MIENIPGWTISKLKEITTKITDGSHNPPKGRDSGKLMLSAKNINNNSIEFDNGRLISDEDFLIENKRTDIKPGDILLTIVATIGRCAVVPPMCPPFTLQRSVAVIKPTINSKYLAYYFQSPTFQKLLLDNAQGTAQKGVYLKTLNNLEVTYPSSSEQEEIVVKIDELLSELDKGKEQLETARQQLKVYRQAVLKWAFEGKLTNPEIREGELPQDWRWVKLTEVTNKITDGEHFRPKTQEVGIPFLSAKDVRDNGVSFDDPLFISEETAAKALQRCKPEKGDILIVSRGATVGRMCIVNTDEVFCLLGSVILIKVNNNTNNKFLNYFLKSPFANQRLIAVSGATAQQAIYLRDIKNINIPICSKEEQYQIVQEIESRLSICDKVEETITQSLQQAETLRQSILKQAFKGKLINARQTAPELA